MTISREKLNTIIDGLEEYAGDLRINIYERYTKELLGTYDLE